MQHYKWILPFALVVSLTVVYIASEFQSEEGELQFVSPLTTDIQQLVVANGSVVPREEVKVKPRISGVISKLLVESGDIVKKGDLLALVEPQPDPVELNSALLEIKDAEIRLEHAKRELVRGEKSLPSGALSDSAFAKLTLEVEIATSKFEAAKRLVEIVKTGTSRGLDTSASEVRATIAGTVLERPVEIGSFVIETNTYNEGSTIVTLADMNDLVFQGDVDEQDAGKLSIGMPLTITVGAYPDVPFIAKLDFIAPQSSQRNEKQGGAAGLGGGSAVNSFQIRAKLTQALLKESHVAQLRSGFSATALAQLHKVEGVLAVPEKHVKFIDADAYVNVLAEDGEVTLRKISVGLSDGLNVEVVSGLTMAEQLVVK
ncbi:MAG: efflux RND transporter periplasmic adaptor subunit [Pseudomonadales bacterium]|nr:efflux RND transporter periplasmic adaptor subunit [Pseudomonadales bacterium]